MTNVEIIEQVMLKKMQMPNAKFVIMSKNNFEKVLYTNGYIFKKKVCDDLNKTICSLPIIVAIMSDDLIIVGE